MPARRLSWLLVLVLFGMATHPSKARAAGPVPIRLGVSSASPVQQVADRTPMPEPLQGQMNAHLGSGVVTLLLVRGKTTDHFGALAKARPPPGQEQRLDGALLSPFRYVLAQAVRGYRLEPLVRVLRPAPAS